MPTERDLTDQLRTFAETLEVPAHLEQAVQNACESYTKRHVRRTVRPGRILMGTIGTLLVLGGGTIASGFASPRIAHVLKQLPVIGGVADALFASDNPSVLRAVEHGFNIPINQSMTRGGITLTVTNAYFGPGQLFIGMTESFAKYLKTHPRILLHRVQILIDGKKPLTWGDEFSPLKNGAYAGDVNLRYLPAQLPNTVTATIRIPQIGQVAGNWTFTVRLSRRSANAATKTMVVDVSKRHGDVAWRINRVAISPATVSMYGDITVPGRVYPDFFIRSAIQADSWFGGGPGNMKLVNRTAAASTWSFTLRAGRPATLGSSVSIEPGFYAQSIPVPVPGISKTFANGEYTFLPGTNEQMTVTGIRVDKSVFRVYYTTAGDQYEKRNFYNLALSNMKGGRINLGWEMEYPSGFRIVSRTKHMAELIFRRTGNWTDRSLSYYPPDLPANPLLNQNVNRNGVSHSTAHALGLPVDAPALAPGLILRVPLGSHIHVK